MSQIQDFIDQHLTDKTFPCSSIIVQGMTGDVVVPEGVLVRFYDCLLDNVEIKGYSTVHIQGGEVRKIFKITNSQFFIEDCTPFMDEVIIEGSQGTFMVNKPPFVDQLKFLKKITIKKSRVEFINVEFQYSENIIELIEQSNVRFLYCKALVPQRGLIAKQSSLKFSSCHFEQTIDYVLVVEDSSFIQISDCHVEGYTNCPALTITDHSVGIVTQADGLCPAAKGLYSGQWTVRVSGSSYLRVKDSMIVGSPGNWCDYAILCQENSVVECSGDGVVRIDGGGFPGIECSGNSSVTVYNYRRVYCAAVEAIKCFDNSIVRIFGLTDYIKSDAVDAIWIRDNSRVEVYDVPLIEAPAGDGVDMEDHCDFIAVNISDKIRGVASCGILAAVYCNIKLKKVNICIGEGDDGVHMTDHCYLLAEGASGQIIGKPDNGIHAADFCRIVVRDYEKIWGMATDGVHMENGCHMVLLRVQTVQGDGPHGIHMVDSCTCQTRYGTLIQGKSKDGVCMENTCRYVSIGDETIQGLGRDGIHGEDSCEVTAMRDKNIIGLGRDGIFVENGKLINARRIELIQGLGRDGIHAKDCSIDGYHIDTLYGEDKCIYVDNCIGTFETITMGDGQIYGLYELNNSDIRMFRSTIYGGPPNSLYMNNGCRLFAKDTKFIRKDAAASEHCDIYFENVTIGGKFKALEHCKHEWLRTLIMDKIDFTDCIYRWKETEIMGDHLCVKCTGKAENVQVHGNYTDTQSENHFSNYTLDGTLTNTSCTTYLKGSEIKGSIKLTSSALKGETTTVRQITDFTGSRVHYSASTVADITGTAKSSYRQDATTSAIIQLTNSGGTFQGSTSGNITLTGSSLAVMSSTTGSVTMSANSSLLQRSGTVGTVSGSNSTFEHHAGDAGAVTITTGSIEQHGGKLGAVSITSGSFLLNGGEAGTVTLGGAAFLSKGGSCGSVSGSGALEMIGTNSGAISVGHKTLPACVTGMVVRVGNDKLYEVFDKNVKRWFDQHLEERVTLDKKINVKGKSYNRIEGKYEVDTGGDILLTTAQTFSLDAGEEINGKAGTNINLDAMTDYDLSVGNEIYNHAGLNVWFLCQQEFSVDCMEGDMNFNTIMNIYHTAGLEIIDSCAVLTHAAMQTISGAVPFVPLVEPPEQPDEPRERDPVEEPSP